LIKDEVNSEDENGLDGGYWQTPSAVPTRRRVSQPTRAVSASPQKKKIKTNTSVTVKSEAPDELRWVCATCSNRFLTRKLLREHRRETHAKK